MDEMLAFGRTVKCAKDRNHTPSTEMLGFGQKEAHTNNGILAALNPTYGRKGE